MSLEVELAAFLKNPATGDQTQAARNSARTNLAGQIGNRIWVGRRQQNTVTPAMTIRRIGSDRYNDLAEEDQLGHLILEAIIWVREDVATPATLIQMADWFRQSVTQYVGTMGSLSIFGITILSDYMITPTPPNDGSDHWLFAYSFDLQIHYSQTAVEAT